MNSRIRRPLYISFKSWLCCCSLPSVAPQQLWRLCEEILKKFVRVVSEINIKALKVQILNEVALIQVVRERFSFQDARTKIHQNFLASKYDIKAIPIKCFVSNRPLSREGGSVGRAKKKKEWTHDCILNLTFSLQDIIRW